MLISPFAQSIINKVGEFNMIFISTMVLSLRTFLNAVILNSPPYQMYVFASLDCINYILYWVACINYVTKLVPPAFNATVLGLLGSVQWLLGE